MGIPGIGAEEPEGTGCARFYLVWNTIGSATQTATGLPSRLVGRKCMIQVG